MVSLNKIESGSCPNLDCSVYLMAQLGRR
jgi:hypothetical protein